MMIVRLLAATLSHIIWTILPGFFEQEDIDLPNAHEPWERREQTSGKLILHVYDGMSVYMLFFNFLQSVDQDTLAETPDDVPKQGGTGKLWLSAYMKVIRVTRFILHYLGSTGEDTQDETSHGVLAPRGKRGRGKGRKKAGEVYAKYVDLLVIYSLPVYNQDTPGETPDDVCREKGKGAKKASKLYTEYTDN